MSPEISIIIPVYNVEKYLRSCLESILQQSFHDWECILINDGSSDKSGQICDTYCQLDSRFKVIHKVNGGVSSARNEGLNIAKGDWVCFVDSDDRIEGDSLEYMISLNKEKGCDVSICTLVKDDLPQFGVKVLKEREKNELIWSCLTYRTQKYASKGLLVDGPCAKLFRMSIIKDYNIKYVDGLCKSEDALFAAEFYHHARRVVFDSYPVYHYTLNPNSICHTYNKSHICMLAALLDLEQEFVDRYYSNEQEFENVVKMRAISALLQVLFESNANKRPLRERVDALKLFFNSGNVDSIIASTRYSDIKPYFSDDFKQFDLWLAKRHLFTCLCLWIDNCIALFKARVWFVSKTKKLLGLHQDLPISAIFSRK